MKKLNNKGGLSYIILEAKPKIETNDATTPVKLNNKEEEQRENLKYLRVMIEMMTKTRQT